MTQVQKKGLIFAHLGALLFCTTTAHGTSRFVDWVTTAQYACETYEMWSPSRQTTDLRVSQLFQACLTSVERLGSELQNDIQISLPVKKRALSKLRELISFLRSNAERMRLERLQGLPPRKGLSLSQIVAIEHGVRLSLSRLRKIETWRGSFTTSAGAHQRGRNWAPLLGARLSLHIDLGRDTEGYSELSTGTPRKEEFGLFEIPPDSSDLFHISQLWVKTQRLQRLQFQLGTFPDEDDRLSPSRWPFLSLGAKVNIFSDSSFALDLRLRHDSYGVWDYISDLYKPSRVERNFTEIRVSYFPYVSLSQALTLGAKYQVHWYTDPQSTLTRLSLGRHAAVRPTASSRARYRVSKMATDIQWRPTPWLRLTPTAILLWNQAEEESNTGRYAELQVDADFSSWRLSQNTFHTSLGCLSVPPLQLPQRHFPQQVSTGAELGVSYFFSKKTTLQVNLLAQRISQRPDAAHCPWSETASAEPHVTHHSLVFSLTQDLDPRTF